ncbi:pumilio homolog 3 isoform X2 [Lingula anatina]|uniref:Pumilio homolog 3 isoform X2 n=1 Tax=Lingula anatina TaxID=7574 RepID=A0A1S3JCA0_LINAN|nr:pumilio homolog 3 isoform X2 [Lingula anatina]|eukprot:XP_013407953.1 pumilio homolog 3 isoform X2 [Lingula anatina]
MRLSVHVGNASLNTMEEISSIAVVSPSILEGKKKKLKGTPKSIKKQKAPDVEVRETPEGDITRKKSKGNLFKNTNFPTDNTVTKSGKKKQTKSPDTVSVKNNKQKLKVTPEKRKSDTSYDGDDDGSTKSTPKRVKFTPGKHSTPQETPNDVTKSTQKSVKQKRTKKKANVSLKSDKTGDGSSTVSEPSGVNTWAEALERAQNQETDVSWEQAVAKARGKPDGVGEGEAEKVGAGKSNSRENVSEKGQKKVEFEKKSKKEFGSKVMKLAGKTLKTLTGKAAKEKENKNSNKRKRESDAAGKKEDDKTKKPKLEEMSKKDRKKVRKMQRTNFEVIQQTKKIWESLRRHDLKAEEKTKLCQELMNMVRGKVKELVFAHDTARVIQCLMKNGSQEQRTELFEELKDDLVELCKTKYSSFFVKKVLKYGTKAQKNAVFKAFHGNVRKIVRHTVAAAVLEYGYNEYATAAQRSALMEEFYGPSFALFKSPNVTTLEQILKEQPTRRDMILSNMKEAITPLVDKTVLSHTIVHRAFFEYFTYASNKARMDMIELLRENIVHMVHTRDGSRVAMYCIWYGTAKDRKVIIKSFKGHVVKLCKEEYGHMVMLALFDAVDDTKLMEKAVLQEMLKSLYEVCFDQYGLKVLLYLLSPRDQVYFHPDVIKVLELGDANPNSKKDAAVRRKELLSAVSSPLLQFIVDHTKELVMSNSRLLLILDILTHAEGDPTAAMEAICKIAAEPFVSGSLENFHIIEHPAGHMTLKKLIKNDAERMKQNEKVLFTDILLRTVSESSLKSWAACNRGCFILITILELNNEKMSAEVKKRLTSVKKSLGKMEFKGAQILQSKLNEA